LRNLASPENVPIPETPSSACPARDTEEPVDVELAVENEPLYRQALSLARPDAVVVKAPVVALEGRPIVLRPGDRQLPALHKER
jgi:hypothetical protein